MGIQITDVSDTQVVEICLIVKWFGFGMLFMPPVSPVSHTVATVSIVLKNAVRMIASILQY